MAENDFILRSFARLMKTIERHSNKNISAFDINVFLYIAKNEGCSKHDIVKFTKAPDETVAKSCKKLLGHSDSGEDNVFELIRTLHKENERGKVGLHLNFRGRKLLKEILNSLSSAIERVSAVRNKRTSSLIKKLKLSEDQMFAKERCEKCCAPMLIKTKNGEVFLKCSAYPACKNLVAVQEKSKRAVIANKNKIRTQVSPKEAFSDDQVTCLVCGQTMKTLTRHLKAAHNLKPGQYRKKFGIPGSQSLSARSYSEKSRQKAIERGLGENLVSSRSSKAKSKAEVPSQVNLATEENNVEELLKILSLSR